MTKNPHSTLGSKSTFLALIFIPKSQIGRETSSKRKPKIVNFPFLKVLESYHEAGKK